MPLELENEIRRCKRCILHKARVNSVPGEGPEGAKIMVCGQAPGRTEDKEGKPFVGMAGKFLNEILDSIGPERETLFITSSVKCFPPKNRKPRMEELSACKPHLKKQIETIRPKIIIALGNCALQALLNYEYKVTDIHGKSQKKGDIIIFPTFHPSAAMRFPKARSLMMEDFSKLKNLLTSVLGVW